MTNPNRPLEPKGFLKTITIIHAALAIGVILFCAVAFSQNSNRNTLSYNTNDPFTYVALILAIGGIAVGIFIFKKQLANAQSRSDLKEKLGLYQAALIQRFAFIEGAGMFTVVAYDISANLFFLIIAGLLIAYFITIRPTKDRLVTDLNLSYEDKIIFDSGEDTQVQ